MPKWYDRLVNNKPAKREPSWLRNVVGGSLYKISDMRSNTSLSDIKTQIDTMRALSRDSQIGTALAYYATDATTCNSNGDIIWATPVDPNNKDIANIINALFRKWNVSMYARDHILELATYGNLYIPTTAMYRPLAAKNNRINIALDINTIADPNYDILPAYKIPPEDIVHIWLEGKPKGYITNPDEGQVTVNIYPEDSVIHFSIGGLLGQYTIEGIDSNGDPVEYDIQFAQPLMDRAVQPTQTLSLLEDSMVLASLARVVKFINIDCGNAEEVEIQDALIRVKDAIEQQMSLNTSTGDAQSFVNPKSPNNLIYLPKLNGNEVISITDLNMAEATDTDNKLLQYYQDKKLSVLGIPKEAMNFSSGEGLGNAGSVMSQRSALYANSLQRLETAYMSGWKDALNKYFTARGLSGYVNTFELHMNPIITEMSALSFDKRDSAINQAQAIVGVLESLGVTDSKEVKIALTEILSEVLPRTGASVASWDISMKDGNGGGDLV